jgi:hypothetical protein
MAIECLEFRSYVKGSMLGFANFYVPKMGLEIYGCSLWQKDGSRWVNLPSREYKDKEGNTKFSPALRFRDKEHYEGFINAAKEAIDVWIKANPSAHKEPEPVQAAYTAPPAEFESQELPF